jgi:tRNA nucleotidyltransferase (CCA-adding enzyme)
MIKNVHPKGHKKQIMKKINLHNDKSTPIINTPKNLKISPKIRSIFKSVITDIKPNSDVIKHADEMVKNINTLLKKNKIVAECVKGGSIAKDTFLKDDYDVDLFVRFNVSYKDKNISDFVEKILKDICGRLKIGLERIHGSRDYFQFRLQNGKKIIIFEVIPVILVHAQNYYEAENITDLSPEHVEWVKRYTSKNPCLTDEIRLAKQFCKANKTYGAESYINGFSGHIIDILIIHYGSFINLLTAFSKFDEDKLSKPIIIDTEKNLTNPLKQLNKSKITPLIIVDPIQKDRNSAAALSKKRLLMFIEAAKKFLDKPNKSFFEVKMFDIEKEISNSLKALGIKENNAKIVRMDIDTTEGSKDVIGTKALKAYEIIIEQMKLYGFKILSTDWNFIHDEKRAEAYIVIDSHISREVTQEGPPASSRENCKKFVDKHVAAGHEILYKDLRAYAMVPRKFIDPKAFIEDLVKQEFINRKVKRIFVR